MPGKKQIMGGEVSSGSQFRDPSIMVGNTQKQLGKHSGESRKPLITLCQTPEAERGQEVEPGYKASRLVQQWPIFSRDTLPPEGSTIFWKQRYQLGTSYVGVRGMGHTQTTAGFILAKPQCPPTTLSLRLTQGLISTPSSSSILDRLLSFLPTSRRLLPLLLSYWFYMGTLNGCHT